MKRTEYIKSLVGAGLVCCIFGGAMGIDQAGQFCLFAFGVIWGHLWMAH